jgi:tetratricopeptide (TPR) repeat protein
MTLRTVRSTAIAILLSAWAGLLLAAPNDFYPALLKRGISHVGSGNFDAAAKELRVAAFGLVDDVPQFEIAQVYLTIAAQKLGHEPDARHAAQRVLAAERLEQHYASLDLPADIRASFEKIVSQILTSDQVAVLHARPVAPVPQPVPQPPAPQPLSPAPIKPQPVAPIVIPTPAPAPRSPAPIKPQPVAPIVVPTSPQPDPGKPIVSHEAPKTPIDLPPAAPRAEVEPPSVPSGPRVTKPPNPVPQTPAPKPAPITVPAPVPVTPAPLSAAELSKRLAAADAALAKNDLLSARSIYRAVVETPGLDHAASMRIAEGSYRARDFATAIRAFERAAGFRKGEEPYHYYLAVSLYETGRYNAAKRELAAALPYIEVTPDIARYRTKIEGAIE